MSLNTTRIVECVTEDPSIARPLATMVYVSRRWTEESSFLFVKPHCSFCTCKAPSARSLNPCEPNTIILMNLALHTPHMTFFSQWLSHEVRSCSAPISLGIWTAERWTDVGPAPALRSTGACTCETQIRLRPHQPRIFALHRIVGAVA